MASEKDLLVIDEYNKKSYTLKVTPEEFHRANTEPGYTEILFAEYLQKGRPIRMESIEILENLCNENIPSNQQNSQPSGIDIIDDEPIDASCKKNIPDNSKNSEDSTPHNWTPDETFLLIDCYEKEGVHLVAQKKDISTALHKCIKRFNAILFEKHRRSISFSKCSSKIDSLKRIYREKLDLQNKSGGQPSSWTYFEVLHNLFHKERWVKPLSTAGSGRPDLIDLEVVKPNPKRTKPLDAYLEEMAVNRRLKQEADALKHREKMARLGHFNESMESAAQSLNIIAAVKKAKLDRDN